MANDPRRPKPIEWGSNNLSTPVPGQIQWPSGGGLSTPAKPPQPIQYGGGRTGVSGQTTKPTGIGLQIEVSADGSYWRYTVPGSGWYSPWNMNTTPPPMAMGGSPTGGTTGTQSTGGYWDRNYGGWRSGGVLETAQKNSDGTYSNTMNQWGQPIGTPGPYGQKGGKSGKHGSGQAMKPEDIPSVEKIQAQISQMEQGIASGKLNKDRAQYRIAALNYMLQKFHGGDSSAGTQSGVAGSIVRWNP